MGVLRLEKRQNCASGYYWYVCSNNNGFTGCCSIDPCTDSICPAANLGANLDAASKTTATTASKTATTAPTTRPATTSPPATTSTGPQTTTSPLAQPAGPTSSSSFVVNAASSSTSITTIPLNGSTATGSPSSTSVANSNGGTVSGNNIGAIVGGVVGGVIFLVLLVIAFLLIRRRKRKEHSASPPYGPAIENHSGHFGLFHGGRSRDSNVNSMVFSDSPSQGNTGFFGFFKKRNNNHYRDDMKVSGTSGSSPLAPSGLVEAPAPPLAPHQVLGLPRNMAELESDIVSARSELSSVSTPLYRTTRSSGSAWSPSPELPSEVSDGSGTGAVLSTARETHYSETSTAGGSPTQVQQNANLRGGGWPGMRANLNSLRRKPNLPQASGSGSGSDSGSVAPQDPDRHVLSFMEFGAGPGDSGYRGAL